jgi:Protein of unknown function (DUF3987)
MPPVPQSVTCARRGSPAIASGEYAASLAEVTQTPADLAGCLALAVLAVAAGGKVWVQAPAWREPAHLFTVVVLPPGNRMSEVYRATCAPIKTAEKALIADAEPVIAEAVIRRHIAEAEADKTAKAAENAVGDPAVSFPAPAVADQLGVVGFFSRANVPWSVVSRCWASTRAVSRAVSPSTAMRGLVTWWVVSTRPVNMASMVVTIVSRPGHHRWSAAPLGGRGAKVQCIEGQDETAKRRIEAALRQT